MEIFWINEHVSRRLDERTSLLPVEIGGLSLSVDHFLVRVIAARANRAGRQSQGCTR
jgi:hypothetical protein